MLAVVSPLENRNDDRDGAMDGFTIGDEFPDFSDENLLESIDFDDLFVGMDDGDGLPDLEILADFSVSGGDEVSSDIKNDATTSLSGDGKILVEDVNSKKEESDQDKASGSGFCNSGSCLIQGEEIVSKRDESMVVAVNPSRKEGRKSSSSSSGQPKNSEGKRKVKVDWTPELHRRFVQAVEQLGVDKAVPSRILELMGIDCLTRHNIASHLQKYRSHRKHLLAREAEAASWSQRRQVYCGATAPGGGGSKRDMSPWLAPVPPTMCFPPMPPVPTHFRPLHVWGHPSMDRTVMPVWPKHIAPSPSPPPHPPPHVWAPPPSPHPPPPPNPSFWHSHNQRVPISLPPGAPYFPQPLAPTSKESIDAAIGDILSKPWQPLPLGLKPPALDSVLVELQRLGIQKVPPAACV